MPLKTHDDKAFNFIAKLDVLKHCGKEARNWFDEFDRAENTDLATSVFHAMVLLRNHEREPALELLDFVERKLSARTPAIRSIDCLLRRWHLSAAAYVSYLHEDFDAARTSLRAAREEIERALSLHWFLLPIATHLTDFRIQLARIARRQNLWGEVQGRIDELRCVYSGCQPFCILDSGRAVGMAELRDFYRGLPLDEEEARNAQYALDEQYPHREWIDQLEVDIFTLPDFVIPYP